MISYRFELYRSGVLVGLLDQIEKIEYGYTRNGFKPALFTYNANNIDADLLANLTFGSEVRILRKGEDDTAFRPVWRGEISETIKNVDEESRKTLVIYVEAYGNVYLKNRVVTETFSAEEEEDIAWGIIDDIQTETYSGTFTASQVSWGIVQKTLDATGNTRDRTYTNDEALKALQQLADTLDTGADPAKMRGFRLTPDLVKVDYSGTNVVPGFYWESEYGETRDVVYTTELIRDITETANIRAYVNRLTGLGKSTTSTKNATTDQDALDFYGMRERFMSLQNIQTAAALGERVDDELSRLIAIPVDYSFMTIENDPSIGKFRCGDILTLRYDDGFITVDAQVRVYDIDISYDHRGVERANLRVSTSKPSEVDSSDVLGKIAARISGNEAQIIENAK